MALPVGWIIMGRRLCDDGLWRTIDPTPLWFWEGY